MAAAIITPASEDLDSRTSSVCIALPAPSAISSASSSRPASRQAAAGSLRERLGDCAAGRGRVLPEPAAELRVGQQALDQAGGYVSFGARHAVKPPACAAARAAAGPA